MKEKSIIKTKEIKSVEFRAVEESLFIKVPKGYINLSVQSTMAIDGLLDRKPLQTTKLLNLV